MSEENQTPGPLDPASAAWLDATLAGEIREVVTADGFTFRRDRRGTFSAPAQPQEKTPHHAWRPWLPTTPIG